MDVQTQLELDLTGALKEKNELVLLTLRQLKTALTNAEIVKNRQALSADEVIKVLRSEVKKRRDAAALYQQGGRPELVDKEQKEIEIISHYLPASIDVSVIKQKVVAAIATTGASSAKDMGKIMAVVLKEIPGVDGSVVSQLVKEVLSTKT